MTHRSSETGRSRVPKRLLSVGLLLFMGYAVGVGGCGAVREGFDPNVPVQADGKVPEEIARQIRACAAEHRAHLGSANHSIAFDVTFASDGEVDEMMLLGSTLHDEGLEACMASALRSLSEEDLPMYRSDKGSLGTVAPQSRALLGQIERQGCPKGAGHHCQRTIEKSTRLRSRKGTKAMGNRRKDLLNQLEAVVPNTPLLSQDFSSICFQILYRLPVDLQLRAALHMCERYLPILEKKLPLSSAWVPQLLGDLEAWFRTRREGTPEIPDEADSADVAYYYGFTDLLVGYHHRDDPVCLTAGVCGMIMSVIEARAKNVFLADDPLVIQLEKEDRAWWEIWDPVDEDLRPLRPDHLRQLGQWEHSEHRNAAYDAIYRREWLHVAQWLRAEAVWQYPEPEDLETMMRGLSRWEDGWCTPMRPERTDAGDDKDEPT